jgi:hypothetical protein
VIGFDFNSFKETKANNENENGNYFKLVEHLWPGIWTKQLKQMNNEIRKRNNYAGSNRKIREVSKNEWWVFIGILVLGGAIGRGGDRLWGKDDGLSFSQAINLGPGPNGQDVMSKFRFNQIKELFPHAFSDLSAKGKDNPWAPITPFVSGYNKNRSERLASSKTKVIDESMCPWKPRTTETGCLPSLSFVPRKPDPVGTEFKDAACAQTGKQVILPYI